ncbi:MAG: hypothetical protein KatS3mg110_0190 [Pirellulaceae bacterium]|nr:MAG: hypothetical protein KatS3mg110_0190 [Pirellulaceae bacterium]
MVDWAGRARRAPGTRTTRVCCTGVCAMVGVLELAPRKRAVRRPEVVELPRRNAQPSADKPERSETPSQDELRRVFPAPDVVPVGTFH